MLIFDTLEKLEEYSSVVPHMDSVISVMDHSTPYENDIGEYSVGDDVKYVVSVHLSKADGFRGENWPGKTVLEITLEGNEMVMVDGSVFRLPEGRFLVYSGESEIKRGIADPTSVAFKSVRFIL